MKVLNIEEGGGFGGPQRRIALVAQYLRVDYGIETEVLISACDSEKFKAILEGAGIAYSIFVFHKLSYRFIRLMKYVIFFTLEVFSLYHYLKTKNIDLVHCNGSWQIKGVIAAKLAQKKCVWHLNDIYMPWPVKTAFKIVSGFCENKYIVSCEKSSEFYFGCHSSKLKGVYKIYPPVDTSHYSPLINDDRSLPFNGIKILTIGNYNPLKGYETLMEAVKLILNGSDQKIKIYSFGEITHEYYWSRLLKKCIDLNIDGYFEMSGPIADVRSVLASCDIFINASYVDAGPMSVFEAMSMGKPIVSTDVGDLKSLFAIEKGGIIVPTKDSLKLAEGILKLIYDKPLREIMGQNARKTAVENLDVSISVERHAEVYLKTIE